VTASVADRERIAARAQALVEEDRDRVFSRTSRMFAWLMIAQWLAAIGVALICSPWAWEGRERAIHIHVWLAAGLGGALSALPVALTLTQPRAVSTRYVVAVAQMLWSGLLIHLTGGRIETHFHVFGSLTFLAFYRDWRVLVPATVVVAADHFVRGLAWPESVYGLAAPEWWRFLEHAFWVAFIDFFLVLATLQSVREMRRTGERTAEAEVLSERVVEMNSELERRVQDRTSALEAANAGLASSLAELRHAQQQLLLADRLAAVGRLSAGIAHEINNPLAYVTSNLDYLDEQLPALIRDPASIAHADVETIGQDVKGAIDEARQGSERVRRIVADLKMFARSDEEQREDVDLPDILETSIKMVMNELRHRGRLVKQLDPVPPVHADRGRLGQVFLNLLINAAQALPDGDPDANAVTVRTCTDGQGRAVVEIRDTGVGIPPEVRDRIFDPFFTTKPVGVGTGLGLSICHSIVSALGGDIAVESEIGRGTVFRLVLPPSAAAGRATIAGPTSPARADHARRILIVDDDPLVLSSLRRILQGDLVTVARNGAHALDLLRRNAFDVILCDLMMPEMTGMELYARLESEAPHLRRRVLFMTGGAFTLQARQFLERIDGPWLQKPYTANQVRELVAAKRAAALAA
jgi:signal transduction histidine kinase/ActR/RegA family two-component response regulator